MMIIIQFRNCALPLVLKLTRQFVKHTLGRKIKTPQAAQQWEKNIIQIFSKIYIFKLLEESLMKWLTLYTMGDSLLDEMVHNGVKLNNYCNVTIFMMYLFKTSKTI